MTASRPGSHDAINWTEIGTEAGQAAWQAAGGRPKTRHAAVAASEAANAEIVRCLTTIGEAGARRPVLRFVVAPTELHVLGGLSVETSDGESQEQRQAVADAAFAAWTARARDEIYRNFP